MAKTVNLEYNSIGSAFGILITIVFCFIIVYFGCMVLEKGEEIVPQPIQYIYRYFFVKPFQSDFDYLYGTSDRYLEISSTSSTSVSIPSTSPSPMPTEEKPVEQVPAEQAPTDMSKCPTKLIKKGKQLMLINENMPAIQGSNPIYFDSLDDYVYYAQVQRAQTGQKCPILYLKEDEPIVEDKQDLSKIDVISQYFKTQQLPQDLAKTRQPAMNVPYQPYQQAQFYNYPLPPAATLALENAPVLTQVPQRPMVPYIDANQKLNPSGQQYGFDPTGQFVGKYTILDKIHASTKTQFPSGLSANAMDSNWGGAIFTSNKLREGEYTGDQVLSEKAILTSNPGAIPQPQNMTPQPQNMTPQPQVSTTQQGSTPQQGASTNPMDPNWGGKAYTENAVKSGEFNGDILTIKPA